MRNTSWDWEDTWQFLAFSLLTTISVGFLWLAGMALFCSGESKGFYIDSSSWWERDVSGNYVVLDSTTMKKSRITAFYVRERLTFTDDPILLQTFDAKKAQDLYFKLSSQKMLQNFKTQSIAMLFKGLPLDEKIKFLSQINLLNLGVLNE